MKVCIIPARGGSKRIPGKNLKPFIGQPIIAYAINVAKQSGLFDRIIVSTDSEEIAAVATEYGAEVPFIRPSDIANDHATTLDVIKHAIEWLNDHDQSRIEAVCCLYATVPFTRTSDLEEGLALLQSEGTKYTFASTRFSFPIQRSIRMTEEGNVEMFWPEHFSTRSQDLEPAYHDAGMFYWGTPEAFVSGLPIFAPHSKSVQIPHFRVQDIDEPDDWLRAEMLYEILSKRGEL
ncbi:pseudaminic acid cytidylyltransferase [Enterovibrio norvegicus FF-162]|uniref:Pseudaminic acid cytidylyltransferase n=1 Tax=Enterovibrio norvegicus FF-454 TaxID=1185651 RepID=A0A1E5C053_9GAMM|nr:pseudaminic acid cytidylyltransferase [Enterovibrio norvegicus]OEE58907.1 pseudaminic acid cytidylyltransferase [Enterovibrio norvegicus FF-454]OEE89039.1 pseudaminic acid cytidylyltransferase [Enterovibrio norvegicus FF-162]